MIREVGRCFSAGLMAFQAATLNGSQMPRPAMMPPVEPAQPSIDSFVPWSCRLQIFWLLEYPDVFLGLPMFPYCFESLQSVLYFVHLLGVKFEHGFAEIEHPSFT